MRQTLRGRADTLLLISGLLVTGLVAMGVTLFLFGEDTGSPGIVGEDGGETSMVVGDTQSEKGASGAGKADRGRRAGPAGEVKDRTSRKTGRPNSAATGASSSTAGNGGGISQLRTGTTGKADVDSRTASSLPVGTSAGSRRSGTDVRRDVRSMSQDEIAKAAAASRARRPVRGTAGRGASATALPAKAVGNRSGNGAANGNNNPNLAGNLNRPGADSSTGNRRTPNIARTSETADGTQTQDYTAEGNNPRYPTSPTSPTGAVEGAIDPDTGALVSPEGEELIPYPEVPGYGEGETLEEEYVEPEPEPEPEPEVEVFGVAYLQAPATAAVGSTMQIPLIIDTTDRYLAAYGLELAWDNSVLSVDEVGPGGGAFDPPFVVNLENDKGQLRFNGISVHPTAQGQIPVATLTVTIHQAPSGGNATIRPMSGNQTIAVYGDDGTTPISVPGAQFRTAVIQIE